MYFRINGMIVFCRGANVVPMDQLEGRYTDKAHQRMVWSASKAGMNMLRVWGGGIYLPESFYDAADLRGILIYHDMMYVEEQFHTPLRSNVQEQEIRETVRNLSHHPSIIIWSGCNEV